MRVRASTRIAARPWRSRGPAAGRSGTWLRGEISSSYGQEGACGTAACQPWWRVTSRSSGGSGQRWQVVAESSAAGMGGIVPNAMTWLCGCSMVAPIIRPRFSKTNT